MVENKVFFPMATITIEISVTKPTAFHGFKYNSLKTSNKKKTIQTDNVFSIESNTNHKMRKSYSFS